MGDWWCCGLGLGWGWAGFVLYSISCKEGMSFSRFERFLVRLEVEEVHRGRVACWVCCSASES